MAPTVSPSMETHQPPASTPPLPLSKRDKRRNVLSDKLSEIINSFADNRDQHYRAQLQAVQVDMNLIMRADPYTDSPLDDSAEEIAELINATTGGTLPAGSDAQADYLAQVGRHYSKFVDDINDAMEDRDLELAMLMNRYEAGSSEAVQLHAYKIRLAQEEHRLLSNTLRERLIQTVSSKRAKILRDKEQLDVADSNALLLHPNQFSVVNPASPGGAQNNRKTRHTRHRVDLDDLSSTAVAQENKRKHRKAAFEQNEAGSPDPASRHLELGTASPFREARSRLTHSQYEAPLYSIERLFTEKELAMAKNTAQLAANNFFAKLRTQNRDAPPPPENLQAAQPDGDTSLLMDLSGNGAALLPESGESDSPPAAPEMERTVSTSHMTTRGTVRNNNGTNPLTDLASAAERALPFPSQPHQPVIIPASMGARANAAAPSPPSLPPNDIDHDLALLTRSPSANGGVNNQLLEVICGPPVATEYEFRAPLDLPEVVSTTASGSIGTAGTVFGPRGRIGSGVPGLAAPGMELGGVPMSAQNSLGGMSEFAGGIAMSRHGNGSSTGGVGMQRTASGGGAALNGARRGRGRMG